MAAIVLFLLLSFFVLERLDSYTLHGHYILVPDLRGISPAEARLLAKERELDAIVVDSVYTRDKRGAIVKQFPLPDAKVKKKRVIQLIVNATTTELVSFPAMPNPSLRNAVDQLRRVGLQPGRVEYVPGEYLNLVRGFRYNGATIEAGTRISKGESIDILLGDGGKSPGEVPVPRLTGKTMEEARDLLLNSSLNLGEVIEDGSIRDNADRAIARVYDQYPGAGTRFLPRRGDPVKIFVSRNPGKRAEADTLVILED